MSSHYSRVLIFGEVNVMDAARTVRRISKVAILLVRKRYEEGSFKQVEGYSKGRKLKFFREKRTNRRLPTAKYIEGLGRPVYFDK